MKNGEKIKIAGLEWTVLERLESGYLCITEGLNCTFTGLLALMCDSMILYPVALPLAKASAVAADTFS